MRILGISAFFHDSAAALVEDGDLIAAAHEERFSRVKGDAAFPQGAVEFCLDRAGVNPGELDYVAFYEKPFLKFERVLLSSLQAFPRSAGVFREGMATWLGDKLWLRRQLCRRFGLRDDQVLFVEHHVSHAASAMFCSPFESAAVITADGVGEWTTAAVGTAHATWNGSEPSRIELVHEQVFPHSLGLLYATFTEWLGFEPNSDEWKVMGLAAYGRPRYREEVDRMLRVFDDGSFELDLSYFTFHRSLGRPYSRRFVRMFGEPRPTADDLTERHADVAASVQAAVEDALLKIARHARRLSGERNLAFAGGLALNSVANGRIAAEAGFDRIFVQPSPGDAGGALGAALHASHVLLGQSRSLVMDHAFWGEDYDDARIQAAVASSGLRAERLSSRSACVERAVDALVDGKIVAVFDGRFEWGPRALGHRSIVADPRHSDARERCNRAIKHREPFRPFAPAVTEEGASQLFGLSSLASWAPERFMLAVLPVAPDAARALPAVTHQGTARPQVIDPASNLAFHELVHAFGEATGTPVVLNTSFNVSGQPIVGTPEDALGTFAGSDLDALALGNWWLAKDSPPHWAAGKTAAPHLSKA